MEKNFFAAATRTRYALCDVLRVTTVTCRLRRALGRAQAHQVSFTVEKQEKEVHQVMESLVIGP